MWRVVGSLLVAGLLVACGSTATQGSASTSSAADACSLLSQADVTQILGEPTTGGGFHLQVDGGPGCAWSTSDPQHYVTQDFVLVALQTPAQFATPFNPLHNDRVAASGVGDQAYFLIANIGGEMSNSSNSFHVVQGQHAVEVTVWRDAYFSDDNGLAEQKQAETAAARILLPHLG